MTIFMDDRNLLEAFRLGEADALRRVYRAFAPKVSLYAKYNFGMSAVDVSEATQLTFIRAFRTEARLAYDGLRPYINYLLRIAHNVSINELKRAHRRYETVPADTDDSWLENLPGNKVENGETAASMTECRDLIEQLLTMLLPLEKQVFDLRFQQGMSQQQVVTELNLTRQKVRTIEKTVRGKAFDMFEYSGFLPSTVTSRVILFWVAAVWSGSSQGGALW